MQINLFHNFSEIHFLTCAVCWWRLVKQTLNKDKLSQKHQITASKSNLNPSDNLQISNKRQTAQVFKLFLVFFMCVYEEQTPFSGHCHGRDQSESSRSQITISWLRKWVGGFGRKIMESEITILDIGLSKALGTVNGRHCINERSYYCGLCSHKYLHDTSRHSTPAADVYKAAEVERDNNLEESFVWLLLQMLCTFPRLLTKNCIKQMKFLPWHWQSRLASAFQLPSLSPRWNIASGFQISHSSKQGNLICWEVLA